MKAMYSVEIADASTPARRQWGFLPSHPKSGEEWSRGRVRNEEI